MIQFWLCSVFPYFLMTSSFKLVFWTIFWKILVFIRIGMFFMQWSSLYLAYEKFVAIYIHSYHFWLESNFFWEKVTFSVSSVFPKFIDFFFLRNDAMKFASGFAHRILSICKQARHQTIWENYESERERASLVWICGHVSRASKKPVTSSKLERFI